MDSEDKSFKQAFELHQGGNLVEAEKYYKKALAQNPNHFNSLNYLGILSAQIGNLLESENFFRKAILVDEQNPDAYSNLGNILYKRRCIQEAISCYNKAIELKPDFYEAYSNLGNAQQEEADRKNLDFAIKNFEKAISINQNYAPAYNNLGNVLQKLGKFNESILNYNQSIKIDSNQIDAFNNLADVFIKLENPFEAAKNYKKVIETNSNFRFVFGKYLHAKLLISDWSDWKKYLSDIEFKIKNKVNATTPFCLLSLIDNSNLHLMATRTYVEQNFSKKNILETFSIKTDQRIHIAYFSSDFQDHPVSYLMLEIFKMHNKNKFKIIAFSLVPPNNSAMRQKLISAFDEFYDVHDLSDKQIAILAREKKVDIAIDLGGHTAFNRFEIFSYKAAPIQVNFLGYSSTSGSDFMDYIIADKYVIPPKFQKFYTEKVCYLPGCFFPFSKIFDNSKKFFSRKDLNLPEHAFVFASFNNSFKITPSIFSVWMSILKSVDNSVLWLSKNNKWSSINIIKEAEKHSIESNRIIFAEKFELIEDHLARQQYVDLFLDTFPYGGHTTTIYALWSCVPILTLTGETFASRIAASMLNFIGLKDLIAFNLIEYEKIAIELATNPRKLLKLREKLKQNKFASTLFNSAFFTKNLEKAFTKMQDRFSNNLSAENIEV